MSEVRQKIDSGDVLIEDNASRSAYHDFAWKGIDIEKAYKLIKRKDFVKTGTMGTLPGNIAFDVYQAHIKGEDIYTHFYINDYTKKLVISSFKKDNTC